MCIRRERQLLRHLRAFLPPARISSCITRRGTRDSPWLLRVIPEIARLLETSSVMRISTGGAIAPRASLLCKILRKGLLLSLRLLWDF